MFAEAPAHHFHPHLRCSGCAVGVGLRRDRPTTHGHARNCSQHTLVAYIDEGQFAQPNRVARTVVCMNTIRTPEPAAALRIVSHHVAVGAQQPKALVETASLV